MNNRPSSIRVFGSSLVANPYTPQFTPYVYGGDQPLPVVKPLPTSRVCSEEGCDDLIHAVRMCQRHYYQYRAALRKDPSLRKVRHSGFSPDSCGTSRGYERHRYWDVPVCDPCRDANTRYRRDLQAAKGAKKEAAA